MAAQISGGERPAQNNARERTLYEIAAKIATFCNELDKSVSDAKNAKNDKNAGVKNEAD